MSKIRELKKEINQNMKVEIMLSPNNPIEVPLLYRGAYWRPLDEQTDYFFVSRIKNSPAWLIDVSGKFDGEYKKISGKEAEDYLESCVSVIRSFLEYLVKISHIKELN